MTVRQAVCFDQLKIWTSLHILRKMNEPWIDAIMIRKFAKWQLNTKRAFLGTLL